MACVGTAKDDLKDTGWRARLVGSLARAADSLLPPLVALCAGYVTAVGPARRPEPAEFGLQQAFEESLRVYDRLGAGMECAATLQAQLFPVERGYIATLWKVPHQIAPVQVVDPVRTDAAQHHAADHTSWSIGLAQHARVAEPLAGDEDVTSTTHDARVRTWVRGRRPAAATDEFSPLHLGAPMVMQAAETIVRHSAREQLTADLLRVYSLRHVSSGALVSAQYNGGERTREVRLLVAWDRGWHPTWSTLGTRRPLATDLRLVSQMEDENRRSASLRHLARQYLLGVAYILWVRGCLTQTDLLPESLVVCNSIDTRDGPNSNGPNSNADGVGDNLPTRPVLRFPWASLDRWLPAWDGKEALQASSDRLRKITRNMRVGDDACLAFRPRESLTDDPPPGMRPARHSAAGPQPTENHSAAYTLTTVLMFILTLRSPFHVHPSRIAVTAAIMRGQSTYASFAAPPPVPPGVMEDKAAHRRHLSTIRAHTADEAACTRYVDAVVDARTSHSITGLLKAALDHDWRRRPPIDVLVEAFFSAIPAH